MSDVLSRALDELQEQESVEARYRVLGPRVLQNVFVLLRCAALYELNNDAMNRPVNNLISTIRTCHDDFNESLRLQLIDGSFFLNSRLFKMDTGTFENSRHLKRILGYLDINELSFGEVPSREALDGFLGAFVKAIREQDFTAIREGTFGPLTLRKIDAELGRSEGDRQVSERDHILQVYSAGLLTLSQFVNDMRRGKAPRHARVKRLCHALIDIPYRCHNLLLALIQLEKYRGSLFCSMLNTSVLSMVFGARIGLNKQQLVDLGMAAFNYHLGRALLGALDRPGDLALPDLALEGLGSTVAELESDPEQMASVRLNVARSLIRVGEFNEAIISRLIVAYETQVAPGQRPSNLYHGDLEVGFLSEIVRMAAAYDRLTSARPGFRPHTPDLAMRRILDDGGRNFDVFLSKLFVNCLGVFPVGTLVELDTGELGMVVNLPSNPVNFHRPQVKLLVDRIGTPLADGEVIDLDETRHGGGTFKRSIDRAADPHRYGVSVTHFFFG